MYDGILLQGQYSKSSYNDRIWPYKTNCPRGSAPTKISEVRI